MKLVSWNVNGLRACVGKQFFESVRALTPDILCLQEIKLQANQFSFDMEGYTAYLNYAHRKGYSGTAIYTRATPIQVTYGLGIEEHDQEGRVITAEYADFYVVCCYTPNSQHELRRLTYRMAWEDAFRAYLQGLDACKPVILCGDLNVAHAAIDLKNPSANHHNPGFTDAEREKLSALLAAGFTDTYRYFYPDRTDAYTWWSYIGGARLRNAGWRIDYFLTSNRLLPRVTSAAIHPDIMGSDHCPVSMVIDESCKTTF